MSSHALVKGQILFHNSVDLIGYPCQAYRGYLSPAKGLKMLQVLTSEVVTAYENR